MNKKELYPIFISIATVLFTFFAWFIVTENEWVDKVFLPSPEQVWLAFKEVLVNGYRDISLFQHIFDSLYRLFIAFFLALITAIPLGILSGQSKFVQAVFDPFIEFYRPLPPLAYYTLLVLWLGIENSSKIALLYLAAFAPLYIATVSGVKKIPQDRIRVSYSLGANRFYLFKDVILPSILPDLFTGIRTAIGFTYTTLVAAEMVASTSGIGWLVLDASKFLRSDMVIMGIAIMSILAILLDLVVRLIEKYAIPWKGKE